MRVTHKRKKQMYHKGIKRSYGKSDLGAKSILGL